MIILAFTIGTILLLSVVLIGVLEIVHPDLDTDAAISAVQSTVTVLVGAVVGYLAGKRSDGAAVFETPAPPTTGRADQ